MKSLSKIPIEYFVVFFLFLFLIMLSANETSFIPFSKCKTLKMNNLEPFSVMNSSLPTMAASTKQSEESANTDTKGVLGIFEAEGLKASPIDAKPINDPVYSLKGSPNCTGMSFGYSNSLGGLCFTDDVKNKFLSRGGNQSGSSSQIGH